MVLAMMLQATCDTWCIMAEAQAAVPACHHATPGQQPTKECGQRHVLPDAALVRAKTTLTAAHHLALSPPISELPIRLESFGFVVPVPLSAFALPVHLLLNLRI
jgi:hypothetical protein